MTARLEPPVSDVSKPFWDATRERRLVLQHCRKCDRAIHYPRAACPHCLRQDLEFRPATGRGFVYAFTVNHTAGNPAGQAQAPTVVALIDLEEGVRMMSNVVGCDPRAVRVGMAVEVTWEQLSDGRALPLFAPRAGGT